MVGEIQMVTQSENSEHASGTPPVRAWRRVRFRLWMLLLAPLFVAILLLICFPKLLTGDFVEVTVVSIENYGSGFVIKMDAWESSRTGWGASLNYGPNTGLGTSSESLPHWSHFIPSWPKHTLITVNLGLNVDNLRPEAGNPMDVLTIKQGETFRVRPSHPFTIATAKSVGGERGKCIFEASRGSRLGL
jgi:hypothetical protein